MGGIFLSYRRADGDVAVLLYAWLAEKFGGSQVFWDREDIEPGTAFATEIKARLSSCNALIALIGGNWTPSKWIQREIALAFRRRILVLPILTNDIPEIRKETLPREIKKLADIECVEMRDLRFREQLIRVLEKTVSRRSDRALGANVRMQRFQQLMKRQVERIQTRALELLTARETDRAIVELQEGFEFIMGLLEFSPGDVELEMQLGYLYKNLAQAFPDAHLRNRYARLGMAVFQRFAKSSDTNTRASALNGVGNILLILGRPARALKYIRQAVSLMPDYGHAWGDLFEAQCALAEQGRLDLPAMREAFNQMKANVESDFLMNRYISICRAKLRSWERTVSIPVRRRK